MTIARLIYFSKYCIDTARTPMVYQLNEILNASNCNNQANGITGALIFDNEWFVQALEGEPDKVWATFKKIECDERHANVGFIEMVAIQSRSFSNWWMGCAERSGRTASVFEPYLRQGLFQPSSMAATEILALLRDLSMIGFERELALETVGD